MHINFIKYRKIYFIFSGVLIFTGLVFLIVFGLKPGIEFTGGSILEAEYQTERPQNQAIKNQLSELDLGEIYLQLTGERGIILRMKDISENTHQKVLEKLGAADEIEERRFESIGPVIGQELKEKIKLVIVLALLSIVLYIAIAFRRVSWQISAWHYGLASLIALFHDVLIPTGILSFLGRFSGLQITIPVVVALLTTVGYSVNNTVVVFDRIRENLLKRKGVSFAETVNQSLNQTLTRQINTSLTTLFPLLAIFFLGGETLKYFALTLILGITAGTYSSIFLTTPLLVSWLKWRKKEA
jgi:preprotein translocase subunit SecF